MRNFDASIGVSYGLEPSALRQVRVLRQVRHEEFALR